MPLLLVRQVRDPLQAEVWHEALARGGRHAGAVGAAAADWVGQCRRQAEPRPGAGTAPEQTIEVNAAKDGSASPAGATSTTVFERFMGRLTATLDALWGRGGGPRQST